LYSPNSFCYKTSTFQQLPSSGAVIVADIDPSAVESSKPVREGLPPTYRMRADRHYVDFIASRTPAGVERTLAISSLESPGITDVPALVPLIESVKQHGVLQPLIVQQRRGTMKVISGQKRLAAAIAAGLREVPCIVHDIDDETAARLREASNVSGSDSHAAPVAAPVPVANIDEDLNKALTTASSLADLFTGPLSELSRSAVGNLLRAELWRALMLLQASRAARPDLRPVRAATPVTHIVDRVVQGLSAERRIRHATIDTQFDLPSGHLVIADERLLSTALASAVSATLALIEALPACRIIIAASVAPTRELTLSVSQEHLVPTGQWVERLFDPEWHDRPGGVAAALSCTALQQAARAHGGHVTAAATAKGSRIALTIPAGS
jgi:ParB-like chromosome segregation protein Spo0J